MATVCQLARKRLADYVGKLQPTTALKQGIGAIKAGFVGSIITPMKALGGNATYAGLREFAFKPAAAGFDYLQSVGKSIADGKFSLQPNEYREVVNTLNLPGLKAFGKGFGEGLGTVTGGIRSGMNEAKALPSGTPFGERLAKVVDEIRLHLDQNTAAQLLEHTPLKYPSPYLQAAVNGAFAANEAVDRPFYAAAYQSSLQMQGKLFAMREGLSGNAMKARALELATNPPPQYEAEMALRATKDAQRATFKDRGSLARMATGLKNTLEQAAEEQPKTAGASDVSSTKAKRIGARVALGAVELNLPFTGVPSSTVGKMAAASPLGFLSPKMLAGQGARSEALAEALLGTGAVAYGYKLAKDGILTGARPTNPAAAADWDAAGMQEYSLKVGDHWVDLRSFGPVVSSLFVGQALAKAHEQHPEQGALSDLGTMAGAEGKFLTNQSYLQNVKGVVDAASDPENRGASLVASQIPVPSLLNQMAKAIDSQEREARTVGQKLQAKIPILSQRLPAKMGSLGTLPDKTPGEKIGALLNPNRAKQEHDTPVLREVRRLGLTIGLPQRTMLVQGKHVTIPDTEYRQMVEDRGKDLNERLNEVLAEPEYTNDPAYLAQMRKRDPNFQPITDEERKKWIEKTINSVKTQARKPVKQTLVMGAGR